MNTSARVLGAVLAVALLAACIAAIVFGIDLFISRFAGFDRTWATITLVAALTTLFAARILAGGATRARFHESESQLRTGKLRLYLQLTSVLVEQSASPIPSTSQRSHLISDQPSSEMEAALLLYGGSDVITRYADMCSKRGKSQSESFETRERLLQAMRKDLGISNFGLSSAALRQIIDHDGKGSSASAI